MSDKRMRVFAGPNGSGKTTIIEDLRKKNIFHCNANLQILYI